MSVEFVFFVFKMITQIKTEMLGKVTKILKTGQSSKTDDK